MLMALCVSLATALGMADSVLAQQQLPPVQLPPRACTSNLLRAEFVDAQGAAGTIFDRLQLVNTSTTTSCTLNGFVSVQMLDASNAPMPTINMPGGGQLGALPGPTAFVLPPGAATQFILAWSDVPVGAETTCASAAHLALTPPGAASPVMLDLPPPTVAPCNSGTVYTSALRPPGVDAP
jgi:hypothetical protein